LTAKEQRARGTNQLSLFALSWQFFLELDLNLVSTNFSVETSRHIKHCQDVFDKPAVDRRFIPPANPLPQLGIDSTRYLKLSPGDGMYCHEE
jgi:hypothetical protein